MVKFSLGREDDGEGPSNNGSSKRPRTSFLWGSPTPSYIEVPEAEEEGGEEGEEGEETREQQEQHRESSDPGDRFLLPNFGSDYHEEEGEEFEEEEYGEVDSADQPLPSRQLVQNFGLRRDIRDGPIAITLMDPEVLDCGICCEPLTAPIFQVPFLFHFFFFQCILLGVPVLRVWDMNGNLGKDLLQGEKL